MSLTKSQTTSRGRATFVVYSTSGIALPPVLRLRRRSTVRRGMQSGSVAEHHSAQVGQPALVAGADVEQGGAVSHGIQAADRPSPYVEHLSVGDRAQAGRVYADAGHVQAKPVVGRWVERPEIRVPPGAVAGHPRSPGVCPAL